MRAALAVLVPVIAAVVQSSLAGQLALGEARPDLLALVVVAWSVIAGAEAMWWAFAGGLAGDLLGAGVFGALTVSLLPIAALFALRPREAGPPPGIFAGSALVALGTVVHQVLYATVVVLAGRPLPELPALAGAVTAGAIYTGILALAVYPILRLLHRRTTRQPAFEW